MRDLLAKEKRDARGAKTLPGTYYFSEEVYREETERIFLKRWLYAGRASNLTHPGEYFLHDVDGESVIVLRDESSSLRAFHNLCRHRGTRLLSDERGTLRRHIRCLYHAWTYSLEGNLVAAPSMDEVPGFSREDFPLKPVAAAEWEGGIFLNLDPRPEPFERAFAPLLTKFEPWRVSELESVHTIVYDVEANWKLIFQNYSECYHCPSLHPDLNRLTPYRKTANDLLEGPFLGGPMQLSKQGGSMTMSGERCAAPLAGLRGDDVDLVYYYTVFPTMLLSLHPDYVLIHRIERKGPSRSRIECDWLFHPDEIERSGFDPQGAIEFWNMTNRQDWHVSELSQRGVSSRFYTPGPYAQLESMIAAFDREYLKAMGKGAE
jgi:Rieske 2Fe-2S family protein